MLNKSLNIAAAKFLMKQFSSYPKSPELHVGELQEVFNHQIFVNGTQEKRKEIMLLSSKSKYESELAYPWDHYYGTDLTPYLQNKHVLDLGCFNGGRGIAWFEKYQMASITGIDVAQEYIDAATQFAELKKLNAKYVLATGEKLPFPDQNFDAIVTFDVMEHVQNLEKTLGECYRVLRPGGIICLVFPSYYHPVEHHLSLVTKMPFIHYFFSGETLVKAYYEILQERKEDAYWYERRSPDLKTWEKGNTINGTTLAKFQKLIQQQNWKVVLHSRKPIGSIGRNVSKNKLMQLMSNFIYPLASVPIIQEIFLHRITYILQKDSES